MYATSGYINENGIVADEDIATYEGYRVIITILEPSHDYNKLKQPIDMEKARQAAMSLSGLWAEHDDDRSVDEIVREMRKGRQFDT